MSSSDPFSCYLPANRPQVDRRWAKPPPNLKFPYKSILTCHIQARPLVSNSQPRLPARPLPLSVSDFFLTPLSLTSPSSSPSPLPSYHLCDHVLMVDLSRHFRQLPVA